MLTNQPFTHEFINKTILKVDANRGAGGPIVIVVVANGGILRFIYPARVTNELKQPDSAWMIFIKPEECPHEILCAARADGIKILPIYMKGFSDFV